jgi:hypothetical protein
MKTVLCWEIVIDYRVVGFLGNVQQTTLPYYNCSESTARRRAMQRRGAMRIVEVRSVPLEEFERFYGVPGRQYG